MSIVLSNGMVFAGGELTKANIVLDFGKIDLITEEHVTTETYVELKGMAVFPGFIAAYASCGLEGFHGESQKAVAAGYSTILLLPEESAGMENEAEIKTVANYGFHQRYAKGVRQRDASVYVSALEAEAAKSCSRLLSIDASDDIALAAESVRSSKARLWVRGIRDAEQLKSVKRSKTRIFCDSSAGALAQGAILEAVQKGIVTMINPDSKYGETISAMLELVEGGKISIAQFANLLSASPAKVFAIRNKGVIAKGHDADLTVVDLKRKRVAMTIVSGNIVFENKNLHEHPGRRVKYEKPFSFKKQTKAKEEEVAVEEGEQEDRDEAAEEDGKEGGGV